MKRSQAEIWKSRKRLLRHGKCPYCGRKNDRPGKGRCDLCLRHYRVSNKKRQAARLAAGLCAYCNRPRESHSKSRCLRCLIMVRDYNRLKREASK